MAAILIYICLCLLSLFSNFLLSYSGDIPNNILFVSKTFKEKNDKRSCNFNENQTYFYNLSSQGIQVNLKGSKPIV